MKSGIYQIRSVDCASMNYVGLGVDVKKRMNAHGGKGENSRIDHAIRKHGRGAFVFEVIEYCERDVLNEREQFWIATLDSQKPNGYNLTAGGGGSWGFNHKPETRRKMSNDRIGENNNFYGKKHSEETRKKNSESHRGESHNFYGKNHKPETIAKLSELRSGEKNPMFGKPSPRRGVTLSPETRRKISLKHKGRVAHNKDKKLHKKSSNLQLKLF